MRVAIPLSDDGRVERVFDGATTLMVIDLRGGDRGEYFETPMRNRSMKERARELSAMGVDVLLCNEISHALESLIASPVRSLEYLGGKLIAYVTAALVGLLPVWLAAVLLFNVPFRGSPLLLVTLTIDFLLASVGMALFIGNLARSQQTATVIALFVFFVPGFFLTGMIDPLDATDLTSAAISYALPRHLPQRSHPGRGVATGARAADPFHRMGEFRGADF